MHPELSIIIPAWNAHATLPRLLESIARQKGLHLQTIVVDDCSEEPYDALAAEWRNRGMNLELIRAPRPVMTKEALLIGLEQAEAPVVTFADADDAYYGTDNLAHAVALCQESNADLLHFATIDAETGTFDPPYLPLADNLEGWDILRAFTRAFAGWGAWGRLYSRDLWLRLIPTARAFPVNRYLEDVYLFFLYAAHARRYVGSPIPAYMYSRPALKQRIMERSLGRMLASEAMRRGLPTYLREIGCPEDICQAMEEGFSRHVTMQAVRYVRSRAGMTGKGPATQFADALEQIRSRELLALLLAANGRLGRELTSHIIPVSRLVSW